MEAVDGVVNLSTKIHAIASKIMTFQDDWVNLSDDYQHQVDILDSRLKTYQRQVHLHGQPEDSTMMKILKKAEDTLQKTQSRLDGLREFTRSNRCCSHIRLWCAKLSIIFFPENIEQKVKKVNEDIDNILKILKEEAEIPAQMREASSSQIIPTEIDDNGGYVPIQKTESAVIAAIEDPQGDRIILLHGGFGKGKSTIARYMVHRYGHGSESDTTEDTERKKLFERVIWVSCASCSKDDIPTKQFEILQDHSPDSLGASPTEDRPQKNRIAKAVKDFFSSKKVLVILDDVTDASFLHEMWKAATGGAGVKYLVTSQQDNICSMSTSLLKHSRLVKMEDPTDDEAMKILASLVGLEVIPTGLQGIARKTIRATEKNPLALACLASHFKFSRDKTDERKWKDALTELHKLLWNTEFKIVLDSTPRSLWAAMTYCVSSLETANAIKILLVMYASKPAFVPEAVLRTFHARMEASHCTFTQTIDELVMRELLKPSMHSQAQDRKGGEPKFWALGSLVKYYMKEYIIGEKKKLRSLIGELVGEEGEEEEAPNFMAHRKQVSDAKTIEGEKSTIAIILCALYFDQSQNIINETVKKAMTRASIDYSNDNFNDLKRQAIVPIIHLLEKPADENWKESDVCCARQVLLTYTCKNQLDDDSICHLLKLDACFEAQLATLEAVTRICLREERPLFNDNNLNFLQVVLSLMKDSNHDLGTIIQEAAFRMLGHVCWKAVGEKSTPSIIDTPGVLGILCNSLVVSDDLSNLTAEKAARALCNLLGTPLDHHKRKIISENGGLFNLVQCLFKHRQPFLQEAATGALANLASATDSSLKWIIADQDGALVGLAKLLSAHDKPDVQEQAARTLGNLAAAEDNSLKRRIATEQGVLIGVVECLAVKDHPGLQECAGWALYELAFSEDVRALVKGTTGVSEGLSMLLADGVPPDTQHIGARALTLINPTQGKEASLTTGQAYLGRAEAFMDMGMYAEALPDLDKAIDLLEGTPSADALHLRSFSKTKHGDLNGALEDANEAVEVSDSENTPFALQERGILKRLTGDLDGALADLNEGLKLDTDDYEMLKHRGYVKFLLKDEEGARVDAEWAMRIKPARVDLHDYGRDFFLGAIPVEYLGYKLK